MTDLVCIREFESLHEAEAARMLLAGAGIDALVQGSESGRMLGDLVPARFPIMVDAQQAASARELLQAQANVVATSRDAEPLEVSKAKRWGLVRSVFGFYAFALISGVVLALTIVVGAAIADAVHPTPYGHVVRPAIALHYFMAGLGLLLTLIRKLRERALYVIPIVALALVAASIRVREAPRPSHVRPRASPWSAPHRCSTGCT